MVFNGKKITIKDIVFTVGFAATVFWMFASVYSIKASKARLEYYKKTKDE